MSASQQGGPRAPLAAPQRPANRVSVPKSVEMYALLTGDKITGVWTHWDQDARRTKPCLGLRCACREKPWGSAWKGYISCWTAYSAWSSVLEVTEYLARQIKTLVDEGHKLRGLELRLWREKQLHAGPVLMLVHKKHEPDAIPPGFCPKPMLLRMWGIDLVSKWSTVDPLWDDAWREGSEA